jgi:hypothetical protein
MNASVGFERAEASGDDARSHVEEEHVAAESDDGEHGRDARAKSHSNRCRACGPGLEHKSVGSALVWCRTVAAVTAS